MKLTTLPFVVCLLALLGWGNAMAQGSAISPLRLPPPAADNLFTADEPLSLTFTARMQAILADRTTPRYDSLAIRHPALLTFPAGEEKGGIKQIPLALVVRGKFRRDAKHCQFPPLYVDFPKKKVNDTPFAGQNTLKLVTHCQDDEYVVREYLVYKLYNIITDLSFRARLARVTYADSANKRPTETRWAYLVEDEDDVARRNNTREYKVETMLSGIDSTNLATMTVFEYMIGNIDWVVAQRHNVKLMAGQPAGQLPKAMPYDFDHAVIVDAAYASRADNTGQRLYRGPLYPGWLLKRVFTHFNELKPQFYALYESDHRLSPAYVKQTLKYLDTFYKYINDRKTVKKHFFNGDTGGKLFASFDL